MTDGGGFAWDGDLRRFTTRVRRRGKEARERRGMWVAHRVACRLGRMGGRPRRRTREIVEVAKLPFAGRGSAGRVGKGLARRATRDCMSAPGEHARDGLGKEQGWRRMAGGRRVVSRVVPEGNAGPPGESGGPPGAPRVPEKPAGGGIPWRKRVRWDLVLLAASIAGFTCLSLLYRDKGARALRVSWEYFQELVFILPAVMILMGLFAVWVRREVVVKYLGREAGLGGVLLAILLGALPTGPLYVAFPLAAMLLEKGARVANVMAFLSAWACIKLPQELVELQFLGWRFSLLRLGLTVALVIPMALAGEALYHSGSPRKSV